MIASLSEGKPAGARYPKSADLPPDAHDDRSEAPAHGPYRGLRSFSASDKDAALFFGRDRERELIAANLLASRLTLLYGQSGIGKSSILCAGIVHELRQPARSSRTRGQAVVYVGNWHGDAREAILDKLAQEGERLLGEEPGRPERGLSLSQSLDWWTKRLGSQILLVLDQFEQYFLHHPAGRDQRFDDELADAVTHADLRLRCLISLREDALSGLDRFKGKIPGLFANRLRLDGLSEQAALEAVCRPVDRYNEQHDTGEMRLEDGLAERVVSELRDGTWHVARGFGAPGNGTGVVDHAQQNDDRVIEPAYLQLVMEKLWLREAAAGSGLLRATTLAAMGGCEEVVRSHIDESLAGLTSKQRLVAARAIRYLVTPSGIKVAHTAADLASYTDQPEQRVAETLERLGALRIMRPLPPPQGSEASRYEIYHDLLAEPMLEWRARFEAQRLRARSRWLLAALSAALAAALAIAAYSTTPAALDHLELKSIDARFAVRGTIPPDRDIVIVYADSLTLKALAGAPGEHPLRPYFAQLIDRLVADRTKVIGVDVEFDEAGQEQQLLKAIRRAKGKIVLAAELFDKQGDVLLFGHEGEGETIKLLKRLDNAQTGLSTSPEDFDHEFRHVRYEHVEYHEGRIGAALLSFPVAVANLAGHLTPFTNPVLIDYHGPTHTFKTVSMIDVLRGRVPAGMFAGKIVVVGLSSPTGEDLHATPFGRHMPGSEIQANAISTVRHGPLLRTASNGLSILLIVAFSSVALLVAPLRRRATLAVFALATVACLALVQIAFDDGLYLPLVYPLLALVLAAVGIVASRLYLHRQSAAVRS